MFRQLRGYLLTIAFLHILQRCSFTCVDGDLQQTIPCRLSFVAVGTLWPKRVPLIREKGNRRPL
jgi:hypothetical protein